MDNNIYKIKVKGEDKILHNKNIVNINNVTDAFHVIDVATGAKEYITIEHIEYVILDKDTPSSQDVGHTKIILLMNKEVEEYVLNYYGLLPLSSGFYNVHHSDHQMFSIAFYNKDGFNKEKFEQLFDDFFVIDLLHIT